MSIEAIAYAKQLDLGACESAPARLLVYVIAENTFNDTFVCRVCQEQLAYEAGRMGERSVRRYLKALEDARLIVRTSAERDPEGRRVGRRRDADGHMQPDAIRIVGYKRWYYRDHAPKQRKARRAEGASGNGRANAAPAANLAGGETPPPAASDHGTSGQIGRRPAANRWPEASGQQVADGNTFSRTSTSRTSPPSTPNMSTAPSTPGPQQGGGGEDWKSGWARGWTADAREVVDELRFSTIDAVADVADVFIAKVRGTLSPPASVDAAAYVRQLGSKLRAFDAATLGRLAQHQLDTRSTQLDTVPNIVASTRAPSVGKGAAMADIVGVMISRNPTTAADGTFNPKAVAAWIAYASGEAGLRDRKIRVLGDLLKAHGAALVPSTFPPSKSSQETAA